MSSFAALAKAAQSQQAATLAQQKAEAEAQARKAAEARKAEEERRKQAAEQRAKQLEIIEQQKRKLEASRLERERAEREREQNSRYKEKVDLKKRLNGSSRGTESPKPSGERAGGSSGRARSSTPNIMNAEERRRALLERQTRESPQKRAVKSNGKSLPGLGKAEVRVVSDPHAVNLGTSASGSDGLTARQRLSMMPVTLTKLNREKRDLRGPLEIQMELQKQRAAAGQGDPEGFREEKKREEMERRERAMRARQERLAKEAADKRRAMSEEEANKELGGDSEEEERKETSKGKDKEKSKEKQRDRSGEREKEKEKERPRDVPVTQLKMNGTPRAATAMATGSPRPRDKPLTSVAPVSRQIGTSQSSSITLKASQTSTVSSKTVVNGVTKPARISDPKRAPASSSPSQPLKRKRTPSDDPSDEDDRRHKQSRVDDRDRDRDRDRRERERDLGLRGEARKELDDVLSMFRRGGTARRFDDYSDDEDMEATGEDMWREEKASERLARLEDERELAAEKRHEEEKRRRRMQAMKGGK